MRNLGYEVPIERNKANLRKSIAGRVRQLRKDRDVWIMFKAACDGLKNTSVRPWWLIYQFAYSEDTILLLKRMKEAIKK